MRRSKDIRNVQQYSCGRSRASSCPRIGFSESENQVRNVLDGGADGSTTASDDSEPAWDGPTVYSSPVSLGSKSSGKSFSSDESSIQEVDGNVWDSSTVDPTEITWDNSTANIDEPIIYKEPTYLSNRFRELHLLYNYLRIRFERICHDFAMQHYGKELRDKGWKTLKLSYIHNLKYQYDKAIVQYHEPGQAALEHWTFFFEKMTSMPREVLQNVNMLRHVAVHRRHYELSIEGLESALKLPSLLNRQDINKEIQQVYEALKFPSLASVQQKEKIAQVIDVYNQPMITQNDLLSRIQHLLESSCFKYAAQLKLPISEMGWGTSEEVELQQWEEYFKDKRVQQAQSSLTEYPTEEGDLSNFRMVLSSIRDLRNSIVHRLHKVGESTVPGALEADVALAMKFAVMIDDPDQARKIQRLAQIWYEENPRPIVELEFAQPTSA